MFRLIFCWSFIASSLLVASASGQDISSSSSNRIALANKYFALAEQFHWEAEFDTTFQYYLKAYEIYKTFKLAKDDISLAREYFIKGYIFREEAQYDSSNFYFENASNIYKTIAERTDDAKVWADYLHCFNEMGRNPPPRGARTLLEPLQRSLQVVLKHIDENHKSVAFSFFLIANAYSIIGDPDKALLYWQKSLRIWKQLGLDKSHYGALN